MLLRRAWAEINLDHVAFNIEQIRSILPPYTQIMAVIKSNAYGHGDRRIAQLLVELGVTRFAVSNLDEAIALRHYGIIGDILILGATPPEGFGQLAAYKITQTVFSPEYAEMLNQYGLDYQLRFQVHIKIDTGMHRIGFSYDDLDAMKKIFAYQGMIIKGVFTHFSVADQLNLADRRYTQMQVDRFDTCLFQLRDFPFGMTHAQNSAGIVNYRDYTYDLVRPGVLMFGVPSGEIQRDLELKPAMELKSKVAMVKQVSIGAEIGYGRDFTAERDMRIATIPIGYGDGYPRSVSGKGARVLINGQYAQLVGKVCMDQLMVDVTDIDDVQVGDTVILVGEDQGKSISLASLSELAGTITNELLCRISARVPREYVQQVKQTQETQELVKFEHFLRNS
ncbi:MAG: alanine racemase [Candidatus Pristimantibacillus lignocellulolyticus]|uniref:Alanine racemase n=1 Tax=Candidatus Pristimantibacillus lignocellulolyticus TaxID=2994561 RepID=A0A9J6ZFD7_9BACL|nr:MAG: alanine racemase [Candidatus Pristimantibacillus lignocellulolyticus]